MWFEEDGAKESISFWDGEEEGGMKEALRKGFGFSNFGEYDSSRVFFFPFFLLLLYSLLNFPSLLI